MPAAEFRSDPTNHQYQHGAYETSLLKTTAPEWSDGELLLGSAYRGLLLGFHDNDVRLEDTRTLAERIAPNSGGPDVWEALLNRPGGLASPRRKRDEAKLPQLMPLVPRIGYHACVRGSHGRSRWYPAQFLLELIGAGGGGAAGSVLAAKFASALAVAPDDDLFAQFIDATLPERDPRDPPLKLEEERHCRANRGVPPPRGRRTPAERFCADLEAVIALKPLLTRRQWTVQIESILRLGFASHLLWVCHANDVVWRLALEAADGQIPAPAQVSEKLWNAQHDGMPFLEVGNEADRVLKLWLEKYVVGRLGLNLLLHLLEDGGAPLTSPIAARGVVDGTGAVLAFLAHVRAHRAILAPSGAMRHLQSECAALCDVKLELVTGKKGFTKNMLEFLRHTLGQIDARDSDQRSYDQGYVLSSRGRQDQRVVEPGPALLIALVHAACAAKRDLPASLDDLRSHMSEYGMRAPAGELLDGRVGTALERLGLVVDSPDAAGGRLLVAPFERAATLGGTPGGPR